MKQYNIDEFVWFAPSPKNKCAISFPRERAFNLNAALCAELGKQIDIAFHPTDPVLCLRKAEGESGLQVPASGSITSAELNERLLAANIRPPVRFTIAKQGEYWIAVPEAPNIPDTVNVAKPAKRPHKRNPARILQGVTYDDRS